MTEIEKQVEEYCKKECGAYYYECHRECSSIEAFQSGAKWGIANAIQWHDLRKDPTDLPKEGVEVLVLYSNYYDDNGLIVNKSSLRYEIAQYINDEEDLTEWYWVDARTDDLVHEVIAWCELPQFKE